MINRSIWGRDVSPSNIRSPSFPIHLHCNVNIIYDGLFSYLTFGVCSHGWIRTPILTEGHFHTWLDSNLPTHLPLVYFSPPFSSGRLADRIRFWNPIFLHTLLKLSTSSGHTNSTSRTIPWTILCSDPNRPVQWRLGMSGSLNKK